MVRGLILNVDLNFFYFFLVWGLVRDLRFSPGGMGVPTICRFAIFGVLFSFFDFFLVLGLVQANYNIFPLGTEKGWSGGTS